MQRLAVSVRRRTGAVVPAARLGHNLELPPLYITRLECA